MPPSPQPSFSPEFATTFTNLMTGKIEREHPTTKRVIASVPNAKRDYKPHPNSRSAWELAVHVAQSDVWFLNSVADQKFEWTGEEKAPAPDVAGLTAWYEAEFPKAMARVKSLKPDQLLKPVDFFGMMTAPLSSCSCNSHRTIRCITAGSFRRTYDPWERRCRTSMAAASTSPSKAKGVYDEPASRS